MAFDAIGELFERLLAFRKSTSQTNSALLEGKDEEGEGEVEGGKEYALPAACDAGSFNVFDRDYNHQASKELLYNMGTTESVMDTFSINNSITEARLHGRLHSVDPASFLLNAQKAMVSGDSLVAEDSIHRYFDNSKSLLHSSKLTLSSTGRAGQGQVNDITDEASAQALEALVNSLGEPQFAGTRHQTAMLALSTMWARSGHFQLALRGTEEAMKTAHQRGDHAAVTKALLLFHVILLEEEGGESGAGTGTGTGGGGGASARVNAEEVLQRCLVRCANLGLRAVSSQAALQLVRSRARGYLFLRQADSEAGAEVGTIAGGAGTSSSSSGGGGNSMWSVQDLWRLMSAMSLGDIHLTARVATSSSAAQTAASAQQIKVVEASGADAPLNVSEAMHFSAQSAETYMDIWTRLSCPEIAEITGRRALRQLGLHATAEDLVTIGTRIAQIKVEAAYEALQRHQKLQHRQSMHTSSSAGKAETHQRATQQASQHAKNALQIVNALREAFPALHPTLLSDAILVARLHVCTYAAMIDGDWERALRLALRLADATGNTAQSGLSPLPALHTDISTSGFGKGLTVRQAQALLLLARITFQFDKAEATALLVRVELDSQRAGLVQYVTLARSLRAQFLDLTRYECKSGIGDSSSNINISNSDAVVESHAEQAWRMDALLLTFNAAKLSKESGSALASEGGIEYVEEELSSTLPAYFNVQLELW